MLLNFFTYTVVYIPQKRVLCLLNHRNSFVYIGYLTFKIRALAVRHVIGTTRNSPLNHVQFHKAGEPIANHIDLFKHGYTIVMWNSSVSLERAV